MTRGDRVCSLVFQRRLIGGLTDGYGKESATLSDLTNASMSNAKPVITSNLFENKKDILEAVGDDMILIG